MQSLFSSRHQVSAVTKLSNLSPEKFGKAAYADLTYTPSKLADNVLYRQVTTLRKVEEEASKVRELESLNSLFREKLQQTEEERDGIEHTLGQQIAMYKKMLHENEQKNETRLRQIQRKFSLDMKILIEQKEQQAKYGQCQKETLQGRIGELEEELNELKGRLQYSDSNQTQLKNELQKAHLENHRLVEMQERLDKQRKQEHEEAQKIQSELARQCEEKEESFKRQMQDLARSKDKEVQNVQRILRTEMGKIDNLRCEQNLAKTKEIKELAVTFEAQMGRMGSLLASKQKMLDTLREESAKNKQALMETITHYEAEHSKSAAYQAQLSQEVDALCEQNHTLALNLQELTNRFAAERDEMSRCIVDLKEDLKFSQVNFVQERNQFQQFSEGLEHELLELRAGCSRLPAILAANEHYEAENNSLRQLLLESSSAIERCKEDMKTVASHHELRVLRNLNLQLDPPFIGQNYPSKQIEGRWHNPFVPRKMF